MEVSDTSKQSEGGCEGKGRQRREGEGRERWDRGERERLGMKYRITTGAYLASSALKSGKFHSSVSFALHV